MAAVVASKVKYNRSTRKNLNQARKDVDFEYDRYGRRVPVNVGDQGDLDGANKKWPSATAAAAAAAARKKGAAAATLAQQKSFSYYKKDSPGFAGRLAPWPPQGPRVQKAEENHANFRKKHKIEQLDQVDGMYRTSSSANVVLYVGLGMAAIGLVITFVGIGDKGFRTLELKLIGPSLVACGVFFAMIRVMLCTVPSCWKSVVECLRKRRRRWQHARMERQVSSEAEGAQSRSRSDNLDASHEPYARDPGFDEGKARVKTAAKARRSPFDAEKTIAMGVTQSHEDLGGQSRPSSKPRTARKRQTLDTATEMARADTSYEMRKVSALNTSGNEVVGVAASEVSPPQYTKEDEMSFIHSEGREGTATSFVTPASMYPTVADETSPGEMDEILVVTEVTHRDDVGNGDLGRAQPSRYEEEQAKGDEFSNGHPDVGQELPPPPSRVAAVPVNPIPPGEQPHHEEENRHDDNSINLSLGDEAVLDAVQVDNKNSNPSQQNV